jgi:hypothetical protein
MTKRHLGFSLAMSLVLLVFATGFSGLARVESLRSRASAHGKAVPVQVQYDSHHSGPGGCGFSESDL